MTEISNNIVVDHVLFRKTEGTLYLTDKVISWKSNTENSPFTINYYFNKINHIKISYKKKVKININQVLFLLKIVFCIRKKSILS